LTPDRPDELEPDKPLSEWSGGLLFVGDEGAGARAITAHGPRSSVGLAPLDPLYCLGSTVSLNSCSARPPN
jgi:hypothetical protein